MDSRTGRLTGSRFAAILIAGALVCCVGTAAAVMIGPQVFHDGGSGWIGSEAAWANVGAIILAPFGLVLGSASTILALTFRPNLLHAVVAGGTPFVLISLGFWMYTNGTASNSLLASIVAFAVVGLCNGIVAGLAGRLLEKQSNYP